MANQQTNTKDKNYDLVAVLYHSLDGAWTQGQYIQDAESSGDSELAQLLRDAQQQHLQLAERAKELLRQRLG